MSPQTSVTHSPKASSPPKSASMQAEERLPPGFEIVSFAGSGSFCDVWQVRDRESDRMYALKVLHANWRERRVIRSLLENEVYVGRRINSPYVARAIRADLDGDPPFALLEWLEGNSLERELRDGMRLPVWRALWIARQCAQGMNHLERGGFVHGDIKPPNIFLLSDGRVKLVDLGFSRPLRHSQRSALDGTMTGTAEYLAPESLSRENFNPVAKDMYSLGITLFRMLTGRLPFTADTPSEILVLQRECKPPLLRYWCPEASQEVADLVRRLLAKHPIRRPASLRALIQELVELELTALPQRTESPAARPSELVPADPMVKSCPM